MNESSANEPLGYGMHIDPEDRNVPADDSPVPAGPATVPMGARPWQGPDRLVLRAPYGMFAIFFLVVLGLTAAGVLQLFWRGWGLVLPTALAVSLLLAALPAAVMLWVWYRQFLLPCVTFDREAGLLTLGWRGLRGRRPLSSVIGVQVMETRKQFGGPEHNIPAVTMYQMNLILDDPAERRLNVMTCAAGMARSNARLVADFLGVPVLDSAGPPTGAAAAGAAEPMPLAFATVPSPVVTEPGPDVLLIRPHQFALLFGVRWMGLVGEVVLLAVLATRGAAADWSTVAIVGASVCLPLLGLLHTLGRRARFDRVQGVLTLGWLSGRAPRSLASVKAVEVVGGSDFRLNLLLDDEHQPRLTLIADAEGALVWRAAERVASFLGVPLLDARRRAPAAATAGAGAAVNPLEELHRSPLPAGRASIRGPARLVPQGEDGLILRPRARIRWAQLVPAVITTGAGLYLAWFFWLAPGAGRAGLGPAWWLLVLLFSPLSLFSAVKSGLLYRDHFDRQTGLLTLGWFGLKGTYPLEKVLAVQLVPGGLVYKTAGFGRGGERVSYQLNLVMADTDRDRLNLTDDSDLKWTRQAGQQLADFLGVPALDQIADGD